MERKKTDALILLMIALATVAWSSSPILLLVNHHITGFWEIVSIFTAFWSAGAIASTMFYLWLDGDKF